MRSKRSGPCPGFIRILDEKGADRVRDVLVQPLVRSLSERPAPALIVDESPQQLWLPDRADLMGFLKRYDEARRAFSGYRQVDKLDYCTPDLQNTCRFTVWERR